MELPDKGWHMPTLILHYKQIGTNKVLSEGRVIFDKNIILKVCYFNRSFLICGTTVYEKRKRNSGVFHICPKVNPENPDIYSK